MQFLRRAVLPVGLPLLLLSCDLFLGSSNAGDSRAEGDASWEEILAGDPSYPDNVYLTELVAWDPGQVGSSRRGSVYCDDEGYPLESLAANALGPPEGAGSYTGGDGLTCPVGINGRAVWRFDRDFVIIDGEGDDFVTFAKTWAWSSAADGLCCELARVLVSPDNVNWYELDPQYISYDVNDNPGDSNGNYVYRNVSGLHGNAPTWANFRQDTQAEELVADSYGVEYWEAVEGYTVSRYFAAGDDYLGGVGFDLSRFVHCADGTPWPADGEMAYLMIWDDDTVLDGQDYASSWSLGANLMSAMGINTKSAP